MNRMSFCVNVFKTSKEFKLNNFRFSFFFEKFKQFLVNSNNHDSFSYAVTSNPRLAMQYAS